MRFDSVAWLLLLVGTGASASEKESKMEDCAMHDAHFTGVTERGDKAMGFSHQRTAHHFGLTRRGGFISAEARDAADVATREAIREHFQHITEAFSSGNFELPMFIHAKSPPGVATMKKLRALIEYRLAETDRGGRIIISTESTKALQAVHQFLRFQIQDHRTADSVAISD